MLRGYDLAGRLLAPVIAADPPAGPRAAAGPLSFDLAKFLYGQNADLKKYTLTATAPSAASARRRGSTPRLFRTCPRTQQSVAVYRQWFQSALGASDLAYLTRQDRPDLDEIGRVAAAMRRLGGSGRRATPPHVRRGGRGLDGRVAAAPETALPPPGPPASWAIIPPDRPPGRG